MENVCCVFVALDFTVENGDLSNETIPRYVSYKIRMDVDRVDSTRKFKVTDKWVENTVCLLSFFHSLTLIVSSATMRWPHPLFPLEVILWWALANPSCVPNLKSLYSAIAEILKGDPKILGSSPSPGPHPYFWSGGIRWWDLESPNQIQKTPSLFSCSDVINR